MVLNLEFFARTVYRRWKTKRSNDIVPMENGFMSFKFNCKEDKLMVKTKGYWSVISCFLALENWKRNFHSSKVTITKVVVWVRLQGLLFDY